MIHENSSDDLGNDKDVYHEDYDLDNGIDQDEGDLEGHENLEADQDDDDDDVEDFDNYYKLSELESDLDYLENSTKDCDPEHFDYECLTIGQVDKLLNDAVQLICQTKDVTPSQAKV